MTDELNNALEHSESNLKRIAVRFRTGLEELAHRHTVTPGMTPEGKTEELTRFIDEQHNAAVAIRASWASVKNRALSRGETVPADPDLALTDRILEVDDLVGAEALVASLEEA